MPFAILTLLSALSLAAVAGWFSIVGFMTIYAGAPFYALVMGVVTECAKLVTTSWLYRNWKYSSWKLKIPLIYFTLALMVATSIGVFGFLSKAHLEQGADKINNSAKIESLNYQIDREKSTIADAEKVISQLDSAVTALTEAQRISGPRGSIAVRRAQEKERAELRVIIDNAQKRIDTLNEEKFKLESEVRELQLEVGPIRYIAELIYGVDDNTNKNIEAAVRIFTLLLVSTLDPLAVILLIAANHTIMRLRLEKEEKNKAKDASTGEVGRYKDVNVPLDKIQETEEVSARSPGVNKFDNSGSEVPEDAALSSEIQNQGSLNEEEKVLGTYEEKVSSVAQNEINDEIDIPSSTDGSNEMPILHTPIQVNEVKEATLEKFFTPFKTEAVAGASSPNITKISIGEGNPSNKENKEKETPAVVEKIQGINRKSLAPWALQEPILRELLGSENPHFIPKKVHEEETSIEMEKNTLDKKAEVEAYVEASAGIIPESIEKVHSEATEEVVENTQEKKKISEVNIFSLPRYKGTLSWINEFKGNRNER